jgi:1-acyl-sn-glycerol-3-phosphate acyltransferase
VCFSSVTSLVQLFTISCFLDDIATLFTNPVVSYILNSTGNIPVDRKSKDRQLLFKGTFEALSRGLAVALFPEGTSYTEPRIMQVKDGAAWAALEYTKWIKENSILADPNVVIVPVAIVYTNKSKYRSNVKFSLSLFRFFFSLSFVGNRRVRGLKNVIREPHVILNIGLVGRSQ